MCSRWIKNVLQKRSSPAALFYSPKPVAYGYRIVFLALRTPGRQRARNDVRVSSLILSIFVKLISGSAVYQLILPFLNFLSPTFLVDSIGLNKGSAL
jgi:hypothetical protein